MRTPEASIKWLMGVQGRRVLRSEVLQRVSGAVYTSRSCDRRRRESDDRPGRVFFPARGGRNGCAARRMRLLSRAFPPFERLFGLWISGLPGESCWANRLRKPAVATMDQWLYLLVWKFGSGHAT